MKKVILTLSLVFVLAVPFMASAQNWQDWMTNTIFNTPVMAQADLIGIIFKALQYILAFLGVVAVVIIIIGGFMWMTAGGSDEKVAKGKKMIIQGLIGLIIILLAYAITSFVIARLQEFAAV